MTLLSRILVGLVAAGHLWFLVLEMFLWKTPFGRKRFKMTVEDAERTAVLAANQGLYNGFLAAGLIWAQLAPDGTRLATFFLACVVVAGLYGAATASRVILYVQALPAAIALATVLWG